MSFLISVLFVEPIRRNDIHLVVDDITKIVRYRIHLAISTKLLILRHLIRPALPPQQRIPIDTRLFICTLLQWFCCRLADNRRGRGCPIHGYHLYKFCIGTNNPHIGKQIEALLYKLKAALDNLIRPCRIMRAFEFYEHLPPLKSIIQLLRMMNRYQRVLLPMNEADLLMGWQLLDMLADIHPRYLKTSKALHLAGNAGEDTWEHAVEEAAASFRQKFRTGLLAKCGQVRVCRI